MAAVIDLFSRRVVGWSMQASMTAQFVTDALLMAVWRMGKPNTLLHHSDQGSQYTSEPYQRLMADHGINCSMILDGAGWHSAHDVIVPGNITLLTLPPCAPELNPVENVWQFLRDNWLGNWIFGSYDDIVERCCLEQAHRPALPHHVHWTSKLGK